MNTIGKTVDNLGWVLQSCTFTVPASASGAQVVGLSFTGGVGGPTIDAVSVQ